jgi:hypothetical protein
MNVTLANLAERPRLTVVIAPERYEPEHLTLKECIEVVSSSQARARGWYFPHINRGRVRSGPRGTYVFDETEFMVHVEQWRMYRSAQFIFRMVPWEVPDPDVQTRMLENARLWDSAKNADEVSGFLSFVMLIISVSEAYLFAACLSQSARYETAVNIQVALRGINGWAFGSNDSETSFYSAYVAHNDVVENVQFIALNELIANPFECAVKMVQSLFEQFGWFDCPDDAIRNWQRKYIKTGG